MKIYIGENQKKSIPCRSLNRNEMERICPKTTINSFYPNHLEGYIYNACTKKPVKHATIIVENEFGCEACITDHRGRYKICMPCRNTWCSVKIKKYKYYRYYALKIYIKENKQDFKICPR